MFWLGFALGFYVAFGLAMAAYVSFFVALAGDVANIILIPIYAVFWPVGLFMMLRRK